MTEIDRVLVGLTPWSKQTMTLYRITRQTHLVEDTSDCLIIQLQITNNTQIDIGDTLFKRIQCLVQVTTEVFPPFYLQVKGHQNCHLWPSLCWWLSYILSHIEGTLQATLNLFSNAYESMGLSLNIGKTKVLYQPAPGVFNHRSLSVERRWKL